MRKFTVFSEFMREETGAVTVDWVVLTAAIVGIGIAVLTAVSGGVGSLATEIDSALSNYSTTAYSF